MSESLQIYEKKKKTGKGSGNLREVKIQVLLLLGVVIHGDEQKKNSRSPTTGIISARFSQQCLCPNTNCLVHV